MQHLQPNTTLQGGKYRIERVLWQYVYDVVDKWINEHYLARLFEKDSSKSVKDKLLDAYLRFKK